MPPKKSGTGRAKSAVLPLLTVSTDGKAKEVHNREVMRVLRLLRADGTKRYILHHVCDGGQDQSIPIALDNKYFDIGYINDDGEIFLVEIMRVTHLGKRNGFTGLD